MRCLVVVALAGCGRIGFEVEPLRGDGGAPTDLGIDAPPCTFGPFSTPQTDPVLNSATTDWGPSLSHDQLTLTFSSSRGSNGKFELYQATRGDVGQPWTSPALVAIAQVADLEDPSFAADGLTMYWGNPEVQIATRATLASPWVNGGTVFTSTATTSVVGGPDISPDQRTIVFTGLDVATSDDHLYFATRAQPADAWSAYALLPGLAMAGAAQGFGSLRGDLLEAVWQATFTGGLDIFRATRATTSDPFGAPSLITEVSSRVDDGDADLSDDGTTLWFASLRPGGVGGWDLWFATRTCE